MTVGGRKEHEAELRTALGAVVASMDGRTNWLTGEERVVKLLKGAGLLVGSLLIVFLLLRASRRPAEKQPPAA